jgi:hypothetical protein
MWISNHLKQNKSKKFPPKFDKILGRYMLVIPLPSRFSTSLVVRKKYLGGGGHAAALSHCLQLVIVVSVCSILILAREKKRSRLMSITQNNLTFPWIQPLWLYGSIIPQRTHANPEAGDHLKEDVRIGN